jgi:hypothetical protein
MFASGPIPTVALAPRPAEKWAPLGVIGTASLGKPLDVRTCCRPEGLQSAYDIVTQVDPFLVLNHIHARLT